MSFLLVFYLPFIIICYLLSSVHKYILSLVNKPPPPSSKGWAAFCSSSVSALRDTHTHSSHHTTVIRHMLSVVSVTSVAQVDIEESSCRWVFAPGWSEKRPDFRLELVSAGLHVKQTALHTVSVCQRWVMFIVNVAEGEKNNPLHTRLFSLSLFHLWNIDFQKIGIAEELNLHVELLGMFRGLRTFRQVFWQVGATLL